MFQGSKTFYFKLLYLLGAEKSGDVETPLLKDDDEISILVCMYSSCVSK